MRIKFTGDPTKTINALNLLKKDILTSSVLQTELRSVHDKLREKVKRRLLSHKPSPKSNPSEFPIRARIASKITTTVYRRGKSVFGGTGNKRLLDQSDPIFSLSKPIRNVQENVRLWRILDIGTEKKYYQITARNGPLLKFKHRSTGKFVRKPSVSHPGQSGFRYFAEDNYEMRRILPQRVRVGLNKIMNKYKMKKGRYAAG